VGCIDLLEVLVNLVLFLEPFDRLFFFVDVEVKIGELMWLFEVVCRLIEDRDSDQVLTSDVYSIHGSSWSHCSGVVGSFKLHKGAFSLVVIHSGVPLEVDDNEVVQVDI
jgi:hypothetical protein